MFSRIFYSKHIHAKGEENSSAAWIIFIRDTITGFVVTANHMVRILGLVALALLIFMFIKPDIANRIKMLSPFSEATAAETSVPEPEFPSMLQAQTHAVMQQQSAMPLTDPSGANSRQQQWVTDWLSKKYRIASNATDMLVSAAYLTAKEIKLDPLLILSVMAIESGLNPFAESPVGAQGLMQVMAKVHHDKFQHLGGAQAALDPVANIKVGSMILKDYVNRGGSVEAGLKLYVGAGALDSDSGYGAKVLAEYRRLKEVSVGKKVPIYVTAEAPSVQKPRTPQENKLEATEANPAPNEEENKPSTIKTNELAAM